VPLFVFQEGKNLCLDSDGDPRKTDTGFLTVEQVFRELTRRSGGAYSEFDSRAAQQLGELLKAVTAFAIGGISALANQQTEGARRLLGQLK
jgi:hypothetical protein